MEMYFSKHKFVPEKNFFSYLVETYVLLMQKRISIYIKTIFLCSGNVFLTIWNTYFCLSKIVFPRVEIYFACKIFFFYQWAQTSPWWKHILSVKTILFDCVSQQCKNIFLPVKPSFPTIRNKYFTTGNTTAYKIYFCQ